MVLVYGTRVIPFAGVYRPATGVAIHAGDFEVPPQLTVRWETLDGSRFEETVPLRLKGIRSSQLSNLRIQLTDKGIAFVQAVSIDPGRYREEMRIHP